MMHRRSFKRVALVAMLTFVAADVRADQPDALKLLKGMTDYVSGQKTISAKFDASIEAVTHDLEKIQFNNSGEVMLVRPDKFRASRIGGYADVELTFDGKTATVLSKGDNAYANPGCGPAGDERVRRFEQGRRPEQIHRACRDQRRGL